MSGKQGRSIVVGVDFDTCGDDAIRQALSMLQEGWATQLHAVHVLDPRDVIDHPAMPALFTEAQVLEEAPQSMRERIEQMAKEQGIVLAPGALRAHARIGAAADALLQVAADYDADMLIVGTHRRRGLDRLLLGSVAERLVRSANCPVLVARPKDHSARAKSERPDPAYAPGEAPAPASEPVDRPQHISTERVTEPSTTARIF